MQKNKNTQPTIYSAAELEWPSPQGKTTTTCPKTKSELHPILNPFTMKTDHKGNERVSLPRALHSYSLEVQDDKNLSRALAQANFSFWIWVQAARP